MSEIRSNATRMWLGATAPETDAQTAGTPDSKTPSEAPPRQPLPALPDAVLSGAAFDGTLLDEAHEQAERARSTLESSGNQSPELAAALGAAPATGLAWIASLSAGQAGFSPSEAAPTQDQFNRLTTNLSAMPLLHLESSLAIAGNSTEYDTGAGALEGLEKLLVQSELTVPDRQASALRGIFDTRFTLADASRPETLATQRLTLYLFRLEISAVPALTLHGSGWKIGALYRREHGPRKPATLRLVLELVRGVNARFRLDPSFWSQHAGEVAHAVRALPTFEEWASAFSTPDKTAPELTAPETTQ